jgi:hypothetical protein
MMWYIFFQGGSMAPRQKASVYQMPDSYALTLVSRMKGEIDLINASYLHPEFPIFQVHKSERQIARLTRFIDELSHPIAPNRYRLSSSLACHIQWKQVHLVTVSDSQRERLDHLVRSSSASRSPVDPPVLCASLACPKASVSSALALAANLIPIKATDNTLILTRDMRRAVLTLISDETTGHEDLRSAIRQARSIDVRLHRAHKGGLDTTDAVDAA